MSLAVLLALAQGAATSSPCAQGWPLWTRYSERFLSEDGRVIDRTAGDRTTSEGQAYALFFALVANDRPRFERVLRWTEHNLAQGELGSRLPAWKWGRTGQGRWTVLDGNPASDADLWLAYALLEAGRLWAEPRYSALGRGVLASCAAREVAILPDLGPMLLPGPAGFEIQKGEAWRLNPSYLQPQLLRRAAQEDPAGPWSQVLQNAARVLERSAARGLVADWVVYRRGGTFEADRVTGTLGSYDAIRAYLWAAMSPEHEPLRPALAAATRGLLAHWHQSGAVPEAIDTETGRAHGRAPPGFVATALLDARARGDARAAARLGQQLASFLRDGLYGAPPTYYDQNLVLFALGFLEGRYRFTQQGRLETSWGVGRCLRP